MSETTEELNGKKIPQKGIESCQILSKEGKICPGAVVTKEDLEKAFGMEYSEDWNFLGPYMALKMAIEARGYFITQEGMDKPSFRVLKSNEMALHASKKLKANMYDNMKIAYILAAHDKSQMTEDEKKIHDKTQIQAAQSALLQQKMLMDQTYF
jgi:hypothetical protein